MGCAAEVDDNIGHFGLDMPRSNVALAMTGWRWQERCDGEGIRYTLHYQGVEFISSCGEGRRFAVLIGGPVSDARWLQLSPVSGGVYGVGCLSS